MKKLAKRHFRSVLHQSFLAVKRNAWYKRVMAIHPLLRFFFAFIIIAWGVLGMITPIPAGTVFVILGFALIFPIRVVQSKLVYIIYRFKIIKLYEWWLVWKRKRRN